MSKMYNLPNISSLYIKLCELEEKKTHIACVYNIPWITSHFPKSDEVLILFGVTWKWSILSKMRLMVVNYAALTQSVSKTWISFLYQFLLLFISYKTSGLAAT